MSNRTDFDVLARELVDMFRLDPRCGDVVTGKLLWRLERELHNAFIAGQESMGAPNVRPRRCRACGEGTIRPLAKDGQQVAIPTCDSCGSEWIDPETAKALDDANLSCETSR